MSSLPPDNCAWPRELKWPANDVLRTEHETSSHLAWSEDDSLQRRETDKWVADWPAQRRR